MDASVDASGCVPLGTPLGTSRLRVTPRTCGLPILKPACYPSESVLDPRFPLTQFSILAPTGFPTGSLWEPLCVSSRSSHLQVTPLGTLRKWEVWYLHIKNAFPRANGFGCHAFLCAPAGRDPSNPRRIWEIHAPAYGLNDAQAAFRRSLRKYPLSFTESLARVGLKFRGSPFDPFLSFGFRKESGAVGAIITHTDDILGSGRADSLSDARVFSEFPSEPLKAQRKSVARVGM